ncbi:MAG TPA: rhodanese-like domain-containing protein, partial [Rudaea sp.]|nr:rhodanese-like domain-containing protein [Rudaea sp.]
QQIRQSVVLLDARAAPRYRGDVEPIDPVAGHIPDARNRPFSDNLAADGRFKSADALREEFAQLIGPHDPRAVVHMCGSGVTACHNLLAMEHAGLNGSRIYAPSWSGWIADPARPVERSAT